MDPYNRNGPQERSSRMMAAMEAAWRACVTSQTPQPEFILVPQWVADRARLYADTPENLIGSEHWWYS